MLALSQTEVGRAFRYSAAGLKDKIAERKDFKDFEKQLDTRLAVVEKAHPELFSKRQGFWASIRSYTEAKQAVKQGNHEALAGFLTEIRGELPGSEIFEWIHTRPLQAGTWHALRIK